MTSKKKVYLLENDNALRDLIRLSLSRGGYEVFAEKKVPVFLSTAIEEPPDLYIIDLFNPGYDSLGLIKQVREIKTEKIAPIIVLSAYGFEEIIVQTIRLGVADFILKPFNTDLLLEKIHKWVNLG